MNVLRNRVSMEARVWKGNHIDKTKENNVKKISCSDPTAPPTPLDLFLATLVMSGQWVTCACARRVRAETIAK